MPICRSIIRCAAALSATLSLMSCGTVADLPPAPPVPAFSNAPVPEDPAYRIQIGDVLDIKLYQTPELNDEVTVRPDGHISTTLVKDVRAAGSTVPELADALLKAYAPYVQKPTLTVVVKTFAPDRIYVGGEVAQPGEFITLPPNLTLSQAIARAGGLKLTGSADKVVILRRGPGDVPQAFAVAFNDARTGANPAADVRLANYDVVYVPRTSIAEIYLFWNQYLQQFVPVSWGFSYVLNSATTSVVQH